MKRKQTMRPISLRKNEVSPRDTAAERAEKERLITEWLRTHTITKCQPFIPEPPRATSA